MIAANPPTVVLSVPPSFFEKLTLSHIPGISYIRKRTKAPALAKNFTLAGASFPNS
jgi:hypothetical protein